MAKNARYLHGQTYDWKLRPLDTWKKFFTMLPIWVVLSTELNPDIVPQIMGLFSLAINFRMIAPSDDEFKNQFYPYVERLVRSRFDQAKGKTPDLTNLNQSLWPVAHHKTLIGLTEASEKATNPIPISQALAMEKSKVVSKLSESSLSFPDCDEDEEEDDDDKVICFAHQLYGGCPNSKKCYYCNHGGSKCMACGSPDHGAAGCTSKIDRSTYFQKIIKPSADRPKGLHPIYGGGALKLLGVKHVADLKGLTDGALANKISQAVDLCTTEVKRLKGGGKAAQETVYPKFRRND